jgi:hypothetical protein
MKIKSPELIIKDLLFIDKPKIISFIFTIDGIEQFFNLILEKNGCFFEVKIHHSILDPIKKDRSVLLNRFTLEKTAIKCIKELAKSKIHLGYKLVKSDIQI